MASHRGTVPRLAGFVCGHPCTGRAPEPSVRREVDALLDAHGADGSFIETSVLESAARRLAEISSGLPEAALDGYEIQGLLGHGGMGAVYRAREVTLDRQVALKLLAYTEDGQPGASHLLLEEARSTARLVHPNICTVYRVGESRGRTFLVMELVEGQTVAERLRAGALAAPAAVEIALQVVDAVGHAHDHGVLHGDLKSANVMLTAAGAVKVLDFGLARRLNPSGRLASSIDEGLGSGDVQGTLSYMAPELIQRQVPDVRTDLWAVGVLLHEMLTGTLPFSGETDLRLASAILHSPPAASPATIPAPLRAVMDRCLAKLPDQRYQSAAELKRDLTAAQALLPDERPAQPRRLSRRVILLSGIGALGAGTWLARDRSNSTAVGSLAVLPLRNLSGDASQEYFADGMTETLIAEVAQIPDLRVISRTSVMQFKGARESIGWIGLKLRVDAILEGSVRRNGNGVAVSVQLVHVPSNRLMWARNYARDLSDVLLLHREIGAAVAGEIRRSLRPGDGAPRSVVPEAYDAYVHGRHFWNLRTENDIRMAIKYFEVALRHDPRYAAAYSGLADSHFYLGYGFGKVPPRVAMPVAKAAVEKSLQLDPNLAEARTSSALIRFFYDWDWPGAEREFRRAIALNPSYVLAHHGYAVLLMTLRRRNEAIEEARRALAADPLSIPVNAILGSTLTTSGRFDEAVSQYRRTLELKPDFAMAHGGLAAAHENRGEGEMALREYLEAKRLAGEPPDVVERLRRAYYEGGWRGYREQELSRALARYDGWHADAVTIGRIHAYVGRHEDAITWLRRAFDARSGALVWLPSDDVLNDALKNEQGYRDLLTAMRLPVAPRTEF